MKTSLRYILLCINLIFCCSGLKAQAPAELSLVYAFDVGNDGNESRSNLVYDGTYLYGTTYLGGTSSIGTIFRVKPNGSEYSKLYDFTGVSPIGSHPLNSIVLSGSILYGITNTGGASDKGTIYKFNTVGNVYTTLYSFSDASGFSPEGGLIMSGSMLYGTTSVGGASGNGLVFSYDTDGSIYAILHEFAGAVADGSHPASTLAISGSTLFGTTLSGGANNFGTIYKINTDNSGYAVLHSQSAIDGKTPQGGLIVSGSILYGTCSEGGQDDNYGSVYKINTDGASYSKLVDFDNNTGQNPGYGSLVLKDGYLWGTTFYGGDNGTGTIYKVSTAGAYTTMYSFDPTSIYGAFPENSLLFIDSKFYGTTYQGGGIPDRGTVFSWNYVLSLPVELMKFSGSYSNNQVVLSWTTASETNNDYFMVEKSTNAIDFADIAKIKGAGNSNEIQDYTYLDANSNKGTTYYRLKQVDFDGKYSYSPIVTVVNNANSDVKVIVNNEMKSIIIQNYSNSALDVFLFDVQGKLWNYYRIGTGNSEIGNINSGVYYVIINNGSNSSSQKIIMY